MEDTELGSLHGSEITGRRGSEPRRLERGQTVGRYVVVELLGIGGMGVVYSAYDPELDRRVALKLLHPRGHDAKTSKGRARLIREAQALAKLKHPHVVTVHDVGEHDGGVFVAMEYIRGMTLKKWMKLGPHPWRRVIQVFHSAGEGLLAAHAKEMTHRDFKPDNVMLEGEADAQRVVVMDFGLATAPSLQTEADALETSGSSLVASKQELLSLTRTGAVMGTPAYMAPEQHTGNPSSASDQFSFCVALYEALYDQRPFAGSNVGELLSAVLRQEFAPPKRDGVPRWLRDVVVRGLAPRPRDRWPSMRELLEALHADPSRKRWLMGGSAGVAAVLLGVYGTHELRTNRMAAACEEEAEAIESAWGERQRKRVARAFAASPLSYADDAWQRTEIALDDAATSWAEARMRSCLARPEATVQLRDAVDGCLESKLRRLTSVVGALSEPDAGVIQRSTAMADIHVQNCTDERWLLDAPPLPTDPAAREARERMIRDIDHAASLRESGRLEDAKTLGESVIEQARRIGDDTMLAAAQADLGHTLMMLTRYEDAATVLEDAYFGAMRTNNVRLARRVSMDLIGAHGDRLANTAAGHRWARHAQLLVDQETLPKEQGLLDVAVARVELTAGHPQRAQELGERALKVFIRQDGPSSRRVATTRELLVKTYDRQGRIDDAIIMSREVLQARIEGYGDTHPLTLAARSNLAATLISAEEYGEAESLLRSVLEVTDAPNLDTAAAMDNLSLVMTHEGRNEEAAALNDQVLALRRELLPPNHLRIGHTLVNGSLIRFMLGDFEPVLPAIEEAQSVYVYNGGEMSPHLIGAYRIEAGTLYTLGRPEEAIAPMQKALDLSKSVHGPRSPETLRIVTELAINLIESGDAQRGLELTRPAFAVADFETIDGDLVVGLHESYAQALLETGKPKEAIDVLEDSLEFGAKRKCCEELVPQIETVIARARWVLAPRDPEVRRALQDAVRELEKNDNPETLGSIRRARAWLEEMG